MTRGGNWSVRGRSRLEIANSRSQIVWTIWFHRCRRASQQMPNLIIGSFPCCRLSVAARGAVGRTGSWCFSTDKIKTGHPGMSILSGYRAPSTTFHDLELFWPFWSSFGVWFGFFFLFFFFSDSQNTLNHRASIIHLQNILKWILHVFSIVYPSLGPSEQPHPCLFVIGIVYQSEQTANFLWCRFLHGSYSLPLQVSISPWSDYQIGCLTETVDSWILGSAWSSRFGASCNAMHLICNCCVRCTRCRSLLWTYCEV